MGNQTAEARPDAACSAISHGCGRRCDGRHRTAALTRRLRRDCELGVGCQGMAHCGDRRRCMPARRRPRRLGGRAGHALSFFGTIGDWVIGGAGGAVHGRAGVGHTAQPYERDPPSRVD
eukprot:2120121-Prymnesium_polylepis.2